MKIKKSKILKLDFLKQSKTIEIMKKMKFWQDMQSPKLNFLKEITNGFSSKSAQKTVFFGVTLQNFQFFRNYSKFENS